MSKESTTNKLAAAKRFYQFLKRKNNDKTRSIKEKEKVSGEANKDDRCSD